MSYESSNDKPVFSFGGEAGVALFDMKNWPNNINRSQKTNKSKAAAEVIEKITVKRVNIEKL